MTPKLKLVQSIIEVSQEEAAEIIEDPELSLVLASTFEDGEADTERSQRLADAYWEGQLKGE